LGALAFDRAFWAEGGMIIRQPVTGKSAAATNAATHAGTWSTMAGGAAGLVAGMFLGIAIGRK